jgi:hypothetical protein
MGAAILIPSLVADALGAPAEPFTLFGGLAIGVGSATQSTGLLLQAVGGYIAHNGQALTSAALQAGQALGEDFVGVPPLPVNDPLDALVDRLAGENPCP